MKRVCYATADTPRAIVALFAPFAAVGAAMLIVGGKGYSLADYPALISTGELAWFPQAIGWLALGGWIVRYFPPAWVALWDGPCIISSDGKDLFLPSNRRVGLSSIKAVTVSRGFFRKVAYVDTDERRIAVNLLFVRPASDRLLRSLATADTASI